MPNVETVVSYEAITNQTISPTVPTNRANSSAIQFIDQIYAQTRVFRFSSDPPPTSVNVWYLLTGGGGASAGDVNGPVSPLGFSGPFWGISGGGGGGGANTGNVVNVAFGSSFSVAIGGGSGGSAGSGGGSSISSPLLTVSLSGGGGSGYGTNSTGSPGASGGGTNGPAGQGRSSNIVGQGYPGGICAPAPLNYIKLGGGGGGFNGAGGDAIFYFGGVGGPGLVSTISGASNNYGGGGSGGGDGRGGSPGVSGGGGGAAAYASLAGIAYFSYPATSPVGNGGSNIYVTGDGRRVHQFTSAGTFNMGPPYPQPDGTIIRANANETIKVTKLTITNLDSTNILCNVWYRKELPLPASNSYIVYNRIIPVNGVLSVVDSANLTYVSNIDSLQLQVYNAP